MKHINRKKEPPQRGLANAKALKILNDQAANLTAICNHMNAPCEQLRSKKGRHYAWSTRRDVSQRLRMQGAIPSSCYVALLVKGQVLELTLAYPFIFLLKFEAKRDY